MAYNVRLRITNSEDIAQFYYWFVGYGNGDGQSAFAYLGSSSAGQTLTTAELDATSDGDYFGSSARQLYTADSQMSLGSSLQSSLDWTSYGGNHQRSAYIYGPSSYSSPRIVSSSAQQAYYLDITQPSGSADTQSSSETFGTWSQFDSGGNALDLTAPSLTSSSFPNSSSNDEIKLVFSERINDSSGDLFTADTFPTITWDTSQTSGSGVDNFSVDSVTYSQTNTANDTITLGISYDGSITGGSVSLSFGYYTVYDAVLNQLESSLSTGQLNWPTTSTTSRTYVDRTFNIYNASGSSGYAYIQVDSGEGEGGSSYLYLGEVTAGGTGSFVVSDLYHNDRKYSSDSQLVVVMSPTSASISSTYWSPNSEFGYENYSEKAFNGSYGGINLSSGDTRTRWDVTWSGLGSSLGFGDWTVYNNSGSVLDLSVGSITYSVTNSNGSGSYVIDAGEKLYKASSYDGVSSFSDLAELSTSDISYMSAYSGSSWGTSNVSNVSITNVSYQTSDDSGAMAIYGTDSTYGEGWFYPVYLSDPGNSHTHTFSEYSGTTFYMPDSGANHAAATRPSSYVNYHDQLVISFTYDGTATTSDWLQPDYWSYVYDAGLNQSSFSFSHPNGTMQADSSSPPPSPPPPSSPPPPPPSSPPPPPPPSSPSETESEYVGSAGGTVTTSGGSVSIPADALGSSVTIGMDISDSSLGDGALAAIGSSGEAFSPIIRMTPHGQTFSSAVTISFDLTGDSSGTCPSNLRIMKRNSASGVWYELPSSFWSCSDGEISISTTSFSDYQAIGGNTMAFTKLSNAQLEKLKVSNKVAISSLDITGSSELARALDPNDEFILQHTGSIPLAIKASAMQDFFSNLDISDIDGTNSEFELIFRNGTAGAVGYDSDGITWNPSSDTLTMANLSASSTIVANNLSNGRVVLAGADGLLEDSGNLTFDGSTLTVTGDLSVSTEATLASAIVSDLTEDQIVLAGTNGALEGDANFTFDGSTLQLGSTIAADFDGTLNVAQDVTFQADMSAVSASLSGDLTVAGDLLIQGSTTTVDTQNLLVEDAILQLGSGSGGNTAGDRGFIFSLSDGNQAFYWDEGDSEFALIATTDDGSASDLDGNRTTYSNLHIGALDADSASTISSLAVGDLTTAGGIVFADASGQLEDSANLTFDGSQLEVTGIISGSSTLKIMGASEFGPGAAAQIAADGGLTIDHFDANWTNVGNTVADLGSVTTVDINGGTIDGATIATSDIDVTSQTLTLDDGQVAAEKVGAGTFDAGTYSFNGSTISDLGTVTTANIDGGSIDGVVIGANEKAAASVTTLVASGSVDLGADTGSTITVIGRFDSGLVPSTDAAQDLGSSTLGWNDLHLGADGVVNFDGGDVTLTHEAGKLTFGGASAVEIDFNNHEMTNVDIDSGTIDDTDITLGASNTLDVSSGTLVLDDDQVYGAALAFGKKMIAGANDSSLSNRVLTFASGDRPTPESIQVYLNGMLLTASGSAGSGDEVYVTSLLDGQTRHVYDYSRTISGGEVTQIEFENGVLDQDDVISVHYLKHQS